MLNEIETKKLRHEKTLQDGKCGIVLLTRQHKLRPNPDINDVSSSIEVITTEHTETPKSIYDLVDEYKHLNSNWEEYDHDFIKIF